MDNDQHNSFAVGITSRDAGYATQEKPKQEEQKQSKSKPTLFLTGVDMAKRF